MGNGSKAKPTDMAFISGKMVIVTRVSGTTVSSTAKAKISSLTGTSTQALTNLVNLRAQAVTSGRTGPSIPESSNQG